MYKNNVSFYLLKAGFSFFSKANFILKGSYNCRFFRRYAKQLLKI